MKKIIASLLLSGLLILPGLTFAEDFLPANSDAGAGISKLGKMPTGSLMDTLNIVINYAVGFLVIVAVFYVIWAGYTFVTSSGDTEKVNSARQRIMFAAIGIVVALLAKGIVSLVISAVGGTG
jgi:hypothetical protein